jgi:hypothetical protein
MITDVLVDEVMNGVQVLFKFPNGYGASMVRSDYTYGGSEGLWEIAIMFEGDIVYDTPIASDVIGYLDNTAADRVLKNVEALPPREA